MAHVVMQTAEFPTVEQAQLAEREMQALVDAYIAFERSDPDPWGNARVPPPLVEFGAKFDIEWPLVDDARFLLKGSFADESELLRVDSLLFFYGGGFDLGGKTLEAVLQKMGATKTGFSALSIRASNPGARAKELAEFLDEADFQDQYRLVEDEAKRGFAMFSVCVKSDDEHWYIDFDDSGVEDWAFVAVLPQLEGEHLRGEL